MDRGRHHKHGNTDERIEDTRKADEIDSDDESDDSGHSHSEDVSWITWWCSLKGNEFLVEVDEDYIRDDFNLTGLSGQVPYYDYALDLVLDIESPSDDLLTEEQQEMIDSAAEMLYGLIHARYILTSRGMAAVREKYCQAEYGRCPRALCFGFPVLPIGQSDIPCTSTVKVYCSKCEDIYYPKSTRHSSLDGAYFGTSMAHLFLQTYPDLRGAEPTEVYIPRIYGFKIHNPSGTRRHISDGREVAYQNQLARQRENASNASNNPTTAPSSSNKTTQHQQ